MDIYYYNLKMIKMFYDYFQQLNLLFVFYYMPIQQKAARPFTKHAAAVIACRCAAYGTHTCLSYSNTMSPKKSGR